MGIIKRNEALLNSGDKRVKRNNNFTHYGMILRYDEIS